MCQPKDFNTTKSKEPQDVLRYYIVIFISIWAIFNQLGENRRIDYKISLRVKSRSSSLDVKEDVGLALGHRVRVGGKNRRVVEVIPVAVFRHKCSVVTRTGPVM